MRALSLLPLILVSVAHAASVTSITQVSNAASFSLQPLPTSTVAQGSFFAIFGSGLGTPSANCGANFQNCIWKPYPLPTTLNGTYVKVTVGATTFNAYIYFASDSQITALMPSNISQGEGQVQVTYNGQTSSPAPVTVSASSFGTFSANQAGSGPGVFFNINSAGVGSFNTLVNTAQPGQFITTYGTGLGAPVDVKDEQNAPPVFPDDFTKPPHNLSVQVWVGSQPATVTYAGRSQFSGEDQINFVVPPGVEGCYVPVAIYAGPQGSKQTVSNFTTLSVNAQGAPCFDANAINAADLAPALQTKGSANIGVVQLSSYHLNISGNFDIVSDSLGATFADFPARLLESSLGFAQAPSVGTCTAYQFQGMNPTPYDPVLTNNLVIFLDAGSALSISGPNGSVSAGQIPAGQYNAIIGGTLLGFNVGINNPPPYFLNKNTLQFIPGTYTVSGTGGAQVGSFSSAVNIQAPVTWNNQNALAQTPISRAEDLTITWTGGQPGTVVDIVGIGYTAANGGIPTSSDTSAQFTCVAPVGAGQFTVPSFVLQSLPSTTGPSSFPLGFLLVGSSGPAQKVSPTPSGLDAAYVFYRILAGGSVVWQ
jgi:uncharacterized protein (TIGR03437 family)